MSGKVVTLRASRLDVPAARREMHCMAEIGELSEVVALHPEHGGLAVSINRMAAADDVSVLALIRPGLDPADVAQTLRRMADELEQRPRWLDPAWIARQQTGDH